MVDHPSHWLPAEEGYQSTCAYTRNNKGRVCVVGRPDPKGRAKPRKTGQLSVLGSQAIAHAGPLFASCSAGGWGHGKGV